MTDRTADDDRPVLLACSHGTRSPQGQAAVARLVAAVAAAMPEVEVQPAFLDVQEPDVPTALAALAGRDVRVVPLLMSAGYHVHVDLTEAIRSSSGVEASRSSSGVEASRSSSGVEASRSSSGVEASRSSSGVETSRPSSGVETDSVTLASALGPDPVLVEILADRVRAADPGPDDTVLLAAAGSSDQRAVADCHTAAEELAARLDRPVTATFLAAVEPAVPDGVAAARQAGAGRVIVASYLLAPGFFADLLAGCGADIITETLLIPAAGPDPRLVALVQRRHWGS